LTRTFLTGWGAPSDRNSLIAWVISGNRKVSALAIDRAIRKFFRLSHKDVSVSPHQPVQFLVKFEHKAHCTAALKQSRLKADGALVQLRPWRPLEHAFGAAMSYRVRLCLEGVPAYGHTPYVAERIIARRCSFDKLDDSSALMTSSRSLDCWAWTANPSAIPKVVWLTFTSRGASALASEVFVHEVRPTGCKRGATFRVIVHLDKMEDYSMAPLDFFGSSGDANAFKPTPVAFNWCYLSVDGVPPAPVLEQEDDEAVARAAALARRARRGTRDDHPRNYELRRDDHDDERDHDGGRREYRDRDGVRRDADGTYSVNALALLDTATMEKEATADVMVRARPTRRRLSTCRPLLASPTSCPRRLRPAPTHLQRRAAGDPCWPRRKAPCRAAGMH
jgi:hypothetical protein